MTVVSDVHLMAPSLLRHKGSAFDSYIVNDRKMFVESTELLDSVSNSLANCQP